MDQSSQRFEGFGDQAGLCLKLPLVILSVLRIAEGFVGVVTPVLGGTIEAQGKRAITVNTNTA